jgi:hypothetical protein
MEGMLGMSCLDNDKGIMKIWVLQDYNRETWSIKSQIELQKGSDSSGSLFSHRRHMLMQYENATSRRQLNYDDNGKFLEEFQWKTDFPTIIGHWFKESLIRHTFFQSKAMTM